MRATIQKWGNSLGVRIPKAMAEEAGLRDNAKVEMAVLKGKLVLAAENPQKEYSLDELLKKVTKKNIHSETSFGKPKGKEVW